MEKGFLRKIFSTALHSPNPNGNTSLDNYPNRSNNNATQKLLHGSSFNVKSKVSNHKENIKFRIKKDI